jgi:hypothetical protein
VPPHSKSCNPRKRCLGRKRQFKASVTIF